MSGHPTKSSRHANSLNPLPRPAHPPPGKKANPPKYWQADVFPAALAFIASTVGGIPPVEQHGVPAVSGAQERSDGNSPSAGRKSAAVSQSAVSAKGKDDIDESGTVQERGKPAGEAICSGGGVPSRTDNTAVAAVPEPKRRSAEKEEEEGEEEEEQEQERAYCSRTVAEQAGSTPFCRARRRRQQGQPQEKQQQHQRQGPKRGVDGTTGRPRGKCLVVCPTGAEASVIVCLCALVAFFSSPPAAGTLKRTASAQQHSSRTSSPQPLAALETDGAAADDGEVGQYLGGGSFSVLRRRSAASATTDAVVTKAQLRWRFLLMQQECPWARPPRRLMQELNEFFMTPGEHSWWNLSDRLFEKSGLTAGHGHNT